MKAKEIIVEIICAIALAASMWIIINIIAIIGN